MVPVPPARSGATGCGYGECGIGVTKGVREAVRGLRGDKPRERRAQPQLQDEGAHTVGVLVAA